MDKPRFRPSLSILMKPNSYRKVNQDILKVLIEEKNIQIKPIKQVKSLPRLERINSDTPLLTEEKLEDALNSDQISQKTEKLLSWLQIEENLINAKKFFQQHPEKFSDINCLLEMKKTNFSSFVKYLIHKHIQT